MRYATHLIETIFSFAVFAVIMLAIGSTAYQVFNPNSGLIQWLSRVWELNPMLLIMLGGIALLVKRWLSGTQDTQGADLMFYSAILVGLYVGFSLLLVG